MVYVVTFSNEEGTVAEVGTGRTSLWEAQDWGACLPESPYKGTKVDFAWGYFAAKQAGKLEELGVPEGTPVAEAVAMLADAYDMTVEKASGKRKADAPLAPEPAE